MDQMIEIPNLTRRFFFFGLLGGIVAAKAAPSLWADGPMVGRDYRTIPELLEGFSSYVISENPYDSYNNKAPRMFVASLRDLKGDPYTVIHKEGFEPIFNHHAQSSRSARRLIALLREQEVKSHSPDGKDFFYSASWDRDWDELVSRSNPLSDKGLLWKIPSPGLIWH